MTMKETHIFFGSLLFVLVTEIILRAYILKLVAGKLIILFFLTIDYEQTLAFMVWCAELYTNRASIFSGPEA